MGLGALELDPIPVPPAPKGASSRTEVSQQHVYVHGESARHTPVQESMPR